MKNIKTSIEGSELVIRVDLTKCLDKRTKKGGLYYASTDYGGNHIPGTALKMTMAVWEAQGDTQNEAIVVDKEQAVKSQLRSQDIKEAKERKATEKIAAIVNEVSKQKYSELEERLNKQGEVLKEILSLLKQD